jgi:hypothetical protein
MASQTDPIKKMLERVLEQLRLKILTSYKLGPNEPTDDQLMAVIERLAMAKETRGRVTEDDFADAVERNCPRGIKLVYQGVDLSDFNALLATFLDQAARG